MAKKVYSDLGKKEKTLTWQMCAAMCNERGYTGIVGIEDGDECWCSNIKQPESTWVTDASGSCNNAKCIDGNPCGGRCLLSLYTYTCKQKSTVRPPARPPRRLTMPAAPTSTRKCPSTTTYALVFARVAVSNADSAAAHRRFACGCRCAPMAQEGTILKPLTPCLLRWPHCVRGKRRGAPPAPSSASSCAARLSSCTSWAASRTTRCKARRVPSCYPTPPSGAHSGRCAAPH